MKGYTTPDGQSSKQGSSRGRGSATESSGNSSVNMEGSRSRNVHPRKSLHTVDLQRKDRSVSSNLHPITRTPQNATPETASSSYCLGNKSLQSFSPQPGKGFAVSDDVFPSDKSPRTSGSHFKGECSVPLSAQHRNKSPPAGTPQLNHTSPNKVIGVSNAITSDGGSEKIVFDIFRSSSSKFVKLQRSLLETNRERRREAQCSTDVPQHKYLREGMVLLKKYIGHDDQVKVAQKCRDLGISDGGFYRPGYGDGAKLHLQMMCLGKNWDPDSRSYEDKRPIDGAAVPKIPEEFRELVSGALEASQEVIKNKIKKKKSGIMVELPMMSPDICIVNFYSSDGRLGLHQDKDETKESIDKGLPVVSFSIGDSAEFLYGDDRDETLAKKVLLESGDVLIFGGESRKIFHGVPNINPKSAPKRLIDDTNLRPGRLNLTFRKY